MGFTAPGTPATRPTLPRYHRSRAPTDMPFNSCPTPKIQHTNELHRTRAARELGKTNIHTERLPVRGITTIEGDVLKSLQWVEENQLGTWLISSLFKPIHWWFISVIPVGAKYKNICVGTFYHTERFASCVITCGLHREHGAIRHVDVVAGLI